MPNTDFVPEIVNINGRDWVLQPYSDGDHVVVYKRFAAIWHLTLDRHQEFDQARVHITFHEVQDVQGIMDLHMYFPLSDTHGLDVQLDRELSHKPSEYHAGIRQWLHENWDTEEHIHPEAVALYQAVKDAAEEAEKAWKAAQAAERAAQQAELIERSRQQAADDLERHNAENLARLLQERKEIDESVARDRAELTRGSEARANPHERRHVTEKAPPLTVQRAQEDVAAVVAEWLALDARTIQEICAVPGFEDGLVSVFATLPELEDPYREFAARVEDFRLAEPKNKMPPSTEIFAHKLGLLAGFFVTAGLAVSWVREAGTVAVAYWTADNTIWPNEKPTLFNDELQHRTGMAAIDDALPGALKLAEGTLGQVKKYKGEDMVNAGIQPPPEVIKMQLAVSQGLAKKGEEIFARTNEMIKNYTKVIGILQEYITLCNGKILLIMDIRSRA